MGGGEGGEVIGVPDDGGEVVGVEGGCVVWQGAAHDEDVRLLAGGDAGGVEGLADESAFGGVGDAQPLRAGACEDRGAEGGAVAVGVGFDDGEDGCRWSSSLGGGVGGGPERAEVGFEGAA